MIRRDDRGSPGDNVPETTVSADGSYHCPMVMTVSTLDVATAAKLFRGFADPTRLTILLALVDDELRVKDLMERTASSQGNVSKHVACLKECGLILDRPEGRQVFYRATHPEVVGELLRSAERLLAANGTLVDLCPNYRAEPLR